MQDIGNYDIIMLQIFKLANLNFREINFLNLF